MSEPREWWIEFIDDDHETCKRYVSAEELKQVCLSYRIVRVIEKCAYNELKAELAQAKAKISEMSDLVQDLTNQKISLTAEIEGPEGLKHLKRLDQERESEMAKLRIEKKLIADVCEEKLLKQKAEIFQLKIERDEYVHEAEHFQHKAIDLDQANGILKNELGQEQIHAANEVSRLALMAESYVAKLEKIIEAYDEELESVSSMKLCIAIQEVRAALEKK